MNQNEFDRWWYDEGSGLPPLDGEDRETHMHRVAEIAWSNGAYLERNAIEVMRKAGEKMAAHIGELVGNPNADELAAIQAVADWESLSKLRRSK
jgi:hypothetical protein